MPRLGGFYPLIPPSPHTCRYWLNDRTTPLRPYVQSPSANAIDDAMWKWVPHSALKGMRFPGQAWEEWQA